MNDYYIYFYSWSSFIIYFSFLFFVYERVFRKIASFSNINMNVLDNNNEQILMCTWITYDFFHNIIQLTKKIEHCKFSMV